MNRIIILLLTAFTLQTSAQNIRGTWSGELDTGMMKLAIVLHVDNDSTCRLDSPDQAAKDLKGQVEYISADSILVRLSDWDAHRIRADRGNIFRRSSE